MQSLTIGPNQAGQRFDKFLHKYLPEAPTGFLYKMLRKKNITLNGKKAEGKEMLSEGDQVAFFLAQETIDKFTKAGTASANSAEGSEYLDAYRKLKNIQVVYEDAHALILNKPAGILTQKAAPTELSLNEWLIGYLLQKGSITPEELHSFKPSVCNRLDRNTSGLVLCGKSLAGSQQLSGLIHDRTIRKFYRTVVGGRITNGKRIEGYLVKDSKTNTVRILSGDVRNDGDRIITAYEPLIQLDDKYTYLEVELITGKTHQIRAHLSGIGHPLLGDAKYGNQKINQSVKQAYGLHFQLLHAYRLEFPEITGALANLSGQTVTAPLPAVFTKILKDYHIEVN